MRNILLIFTLCITFHLVSAQGDGKSDYVKQGIALHDQGRFEEAIEKYKKAIALDSNNVDAWYEMAYSYSSLNDCAKAEEICKNLIARFPEAEAMPNVYTVYGNCLDLQKRPKEAIAVYEEAIRKFPNEHMLYFNKGITESGQKKYQQARESFRSSVKLNPYHASSFRALAIIEEEMGNRIPALLCYSRFLILEPKGNRAKVVLPYMIKTVNNLYYQEKTSSGSIAIRSSAKIRRDSVPYGFEQIEQQLLTLETFSSALKMEQQSELEEFRTHMATIFQLCKSYLKDNKESNNFYWKYIVPYFAELSEKQYEEVFVHYINIWEGADKTVSEEWFKKKKNEPKAYAFEEWNKKYEWKF